MDNIPEATPPKRVRPRYKALYQESQKEIEELKEYKRIVECVWIDLYSADKHGCEIGWKDISGITNYDEEQAKKLYEDCYEDESEEEEDSE